MTPHRGEAGATTAEVPVDGPTLDGRALVDTAAPDIPPARVDDEPPAIGRYRVRRRLGAGAMGVVYAAYDEALDREVAVKLLHGDADHPRRDERLLREAQAMAKLSHPNVAQVYEAGIHDGEVFIAMELIHGTTLRRWLDAAARPWAAIVERFVAAGRGLQAAHAAGVVHRDFKPDNVLVGDDGRVVVVDFGVARLGRNLRLARGPDSTDRPLGDSADGTVVGTPAYMSPEQWLGGPVDPRSDQFSLCAALFEALHRRRPFAGDTAVELARNVLSGTLVAPPRPRRAPRWLDRPIARGLSVHPDRRFPTIDALLAELTRERQRRRRRWLLALAGIALAGGLGFAASALRHGDPCASAGDRVHAVWSPARRQALARSFAAGPDWIAAAWSRVDGHLGAYADAWDHAARDACAATRVRGEASEELLDQRGACLSTRLRALDAAAATFEHEAQAALDRADDVLVTLPPIDPCADADYVRARVPPPASPAVAEAVERVRDRLAAVRSAIDTGDPRRHLGELVALTRAAGDLAYAPALAEAAALHGLVLQRLADPAATEVLGRAYRTAGASGHDEVALDVALQLLHTAPADAADAWSAVAEALLDRLHVADLVRARFHYARLMSVCGDGVCDVPIDPLIAAIDRHRREAGDDSPVLAKLMLELANIHMLARDSPAAERAYVDALARLERLLGPTHPRLLLSLGNLARLALDRDDLAAAAAHLARMRAILGDDYSPSHPFVLGLRRLEADLAWAAGTPERAADNLLRAVEAAEPSPLLAHPRVRLAMMQRALGRRAEALEGLRRSGALETAAISLRLDALAQAALLAAELGDLAGARMHLAAARALPEPTGLLARWYLDLAEARLTAADGDRPGAVARLETLLAADLAPGIRGDVAAALAHIVAADDPAHARRLTAAADAAYAAAGPSYAHLRRELAARP